jgi:hypothetical protein
VKNLVNRQYLLFSRTGRHSKLARRSCKIRREKHYTAFVKVVEGSEIYNFTIHHIVHFYSNFGRKSWSNRGTPSKFLPRARSRARPLRANAAHLGIRAVRALPEVPSRLPNTTRPFPTSRACRGHRTSRRRTSSPARRRTELPGRPRPARAAPLPCSCSHFAI